MKNHYFRRSLLIGLSLFVIILAFAWGKETAPAVQKQSVLSMGAPAFVQTAYAEENAINDYLDEAGIAAWYEAPSTIDLSLARNAFRTIEVETADYIIGSVPVNGYGEAHDVHVYVHVDGWILAYYLVAEPSGKIFDWYEYFNGDRTNIKTKLENTLAVVAGESGVSYTGGTHYDFRYPNANSLMLIVDGVYQSTDSFQVNVPGSFIYYERSWSLVTHGFSPYATYDMDGSEIASVSSDWEIKQGLFSGSQLLPDTFHTIEVSATHDDVGFAGLALVYRDQ